MNVVACTEGLLSNFGPGGAVMDVLPGGKWWEVSKQCFSTNNDPQILYSSGFNILNLLACLLGAALFGKISLLLLLGLSTCILTVGASFFLDKEVQLTFGNGSLSQIGVFRGITNNNMSGIETFWSDNWSANYSRDCSNPEAEVDSALFFLDFFQVDFFGVFGVVFSSVTGIMAGANLSGELKDPAYSIPRGTLSACAITFVTFMSLSILTALTCSPTLILNDCFYMSEFTVWSGFVLIGVTLATWSASLSNLIGASRLINAIAVDNIFGSALQFITEGTYKDNPIVAVVISSLLVQLFFFIGGLNEIAQLAAVLYLLSYAAVNMACMCLDLSSAPNFRSDFSSSFHQMKFNVSDQASVGSTGSPAS